MSDSTQREPSPYGNWECPESRVSSDAEDFAGWFKSFAIAAGAIAKSAK